MTRDIVIHFQNSNVLLIVHQPEQSSTSSSHLPLQLIGGAINDLTTPIHLTADIEKRSLDKINNFLTQKMEIQADFPALLALTRESDTLDGVSTAVNDSEG
jgi:hypothetical protein